MVGYRDGDGSDPMDDATLQRQLQDRLEYVKNHLIIKVRGFVIDLWCHKHVQKVITSSLFSHCFCCIFFLSPHFDILGSMSFKKRIIQYHQRHLLQQQHHQRRITVPTIILVMKIKDRKEKQMVTMIMPTITTTRQTMKFLQSHHR